MSSGTSYNGWPANSDPNAIGIDKNWGAKVGAPPFGSGGYAGGLKSGDVSTVFVYLVNRLHREVEPMMSSGGSLGYGCWGYSYRANVNNPSTLSCHASGTAIDYNAPKHPNGSSTGPNGGGGWTGAQYNKIKEILNYIGVISWLTSNDPMHFEIKGNASAVANAAKKISGGSQPGPTPPTPTPIPPIPEGTNMPLIVKRENGNVDWAWDDALRLMIRIPSQPFYNNLEFGGIINIGHGQAPSCDTGYINWLKGQVLNSGGFVYEPEQ